LQLPSIQPQFSRNVHSCLEDLQEDAWYRRVIMSFQVAARTILQLGEELISSDEIAFYELIKNSFDAQSQSVEIAIVVRLPFDDCEELRRKLLEHKTEEGKAGVELIIEMKDTISVRVRSDAPLVDAFVRQVQQADAMDDLFNLIEEANYIDIKDTGEGMSLQDLLEVYLTVGTRSRLKQRHRNWKGVRGGSSTESLRPILGEKGVGRFSAMRLGRRLDVNTSKRGETYWNKLSIDWSMFSNDSDELLEDIRVAPERGSHKQSKAESGTLIHLSGLRSAWNTKKVTDMVEKEFSRFTDPFNPKAKYPIAVYYNDVLFPVPDFDQSIFKHAHATVEAQLTSDDESGVRLKGRVNYRFRDMKKSFDLRDADVKSAAGDVRSLQVLTSLGPFKMRAYWYNRRLLTAAAGVPNFQHIKQVVNEWAGGLMVYRDSFRVHPYGGRDDDWLHLDKKALASGGYKVNRRQIIGKVDITSRQNPQLTDQTNREGLRDCEEKGALVLLLKHVLETEMRVFLNNVEERMHQHTQLDLDVLEKRVDDQIKAALRSVQEIVQRVPEADRETRVVTDIHDVFREIQQSLSAAREIAESYKRGHARMVHLAGIGLTVEMLAHELNRAALHTLATLSDSQRGDLPADVKSRFKTLESQMKTLQKRLQVLDPLSTTARQRKETFDMVLWAKEVLASHEEQFRRHDIKLHIEVLPDSWASLRIKAVKGMIVQVLENLISNSVYWLRQQKEISKRFLPEIHVVIDTESKEILFTDNGPGIEPERKDDIFLPFVTTKPSGEGKGLGLYIAREIATYHDAKLYLSEVPSVHKRKLNTFIFALESRT
jgi:signal transduction histidine kinase